MFLNKNGEMRNIQNKNFSKQSKKLWKCVKFEEVMFGETKYNMKIRIVELV